MMFSASRISQVGQASSRTCACQLHHALKMGKASHHCKQLVPGNFWRTLPVMVASAFGNKGITPGRQAQATASSSTVAAAATASPKVLADAVFYTKTAALKIGPIGPQHITAGRAGIRVKSGTATYVVSIAMRYAPDGRSNCDWRNELKIALDCEEAVTALLHKREEPLEFLHDTLLGKGQGGELMTKLTWSVAPETGGVLVSIQQTSRANGEDITREAACELTAAQLQIIEQLVYSTLYIMYGFDLALLS